MFDFFVLCFVFCFCVHYLHPPHQARELSLRRQQLFSQMDSQWNAELQQSESSQKAQELMMSQLKQQGIHASDFILSLLI
jgi:hypothetical protein